MAIGIVTAEPQSIIEALRKVAEPLCCRMPNVKQAEDTRKKLQMLEGDLKTGAVKEGMRQLIATLLKNLAACDRAEAEKTQVKFSIPCHAAQSVSALHYMPRTCPDE